MIDLNPHHLDTVLSILKAHVPDDTVLAFGSRAKWTASEFSDLDLVICGTNAHDFLTLGLLREAFDESDLPIRVDVHDWNSIPDHFKPNIQGSFEVLVHGNGDMPLSGVGSTRSLGDVAHVVMGQSPPGETVAAFGETPLLNGPTDFGPRHPVPTQYTSESRRFAETGDILFCVRGSTTGRMNWADQRYAIGRGVAALRHRRDAALQPLLHAVVALALPSLLAESTGSTFPNVSKDQIARILWPALSMEQEHRAARILGSIDDRIEVNRHLSETLEAMAQALFKSWFIDFEPVRAKMEGRDTGLPDQIADLFPDSLVDSPLGPIPEGWEAKPLSALARFLNGLAMQKYPPVGEGRLPVLKIAQLRAGHLARADFVRDDIDDKYVVVDGDIVFSWSGSLECKYWTGGPAALNQHLFRVLPRQHPPWLCYSAIIHHLAKFREVANDKATTMGHIQRRHLDEALQAVPPADALRSFNVLIAPLMQRSIQANVSSRNLAGLRDILLAHLLTGHSGGEHVVSQTERSPSSDETRMSVQLSGKFELG